MQWQHDPWAVQYHEIALVDGFDHSGNVYYAWCDQGVYQTPQNYPMTQSGPVPAPM